MIQDSRPISILADTHSRGVAVAVALATLALLGGVAAAGTATAQSDRPTVVVTDGTTAPDGTTTVGVVLTDAPDGLAGYYLELTVENPEVARIESAGYPDRFGLTSDPDIGADGATVALEAADMEGAIEPGATDVTLATVTVVGASPGEVGLSVEPRQFDDDSGGVFSPGTQAGTLTVSAGDTEQSASGSTASDADADTDADTGTDGTSTARDEDDTDATDSTAGDGSLPTTLTLIAVATLAIAGLRRRA